MKLIQKYTDVTNRLWQRQRIVKAAINSLWLSGDSILRLIVGLFVGVWLARYLGPDQYGIWNFALAFTAVFSFLTGLGLDNVVVRNLTKEPERKNEILGTAFFLKLMASLLALPVMMIIVIAVRPDDNLTVVLVLLNALGFVVQSFTTIAFFFQAQIQSKFYVYAVDASFLLITVVKVLLLLFEAPLLAFGVATLLESIFSALFLIAVYKLNRQSISNWRFNKTISVSLLKDCWPLMLSSAAIMIYMKIDQLMIGEMLGNSELGVYSAAVRISESWYFVPMAIASSVFPTIVGIREQNSVSYLIQLKRLLDLMAVVGMSVAILFSITGNFAIRILFGETYQEAGTVLMIHCWGGVFVCIGVVSSMWLVAENLQRYSFYRTLIGAVINILLNLVLIPFWGCNGAAIATVISYCIATYSIIFFAEGKIIRPMMLASLIPSQWFFVRTAGRV